MIYFFKKKVSIEHPGLWLVHQRHVDGSVPRPLVREHPSFFRRLSARPRVVRRRLCAFLGLHQQPPGRADSGGAWATHRHVQGENTGQPVYQANTEPRCSQEEEESWFFELAKLNDAFCRIFWGCKRAVAKSGILTGRLSSTSWDTQRGLRSGASWPTSTWGTPTSTSQVSHHDLLSIFFYWVQHLSHLFNSLMLILILFLTFSLLRKSSLEGNGSTAEKWCWWRDCPAGVHVQHGRTQNLQQIQVKTLNFIFCATLVKQDIKA